MVSLSQFTGPPLRGAQDGDSLRVVDRLPVIHVTRDTPGAATGPNEGISLYVPVEEGLLMRFTSAWYNRGLLEALRIVAEERTSGEGGLHLTISHLAKSILTLVDTLAGIRYIFQPHLKDLGPKLTALYSHTRDWSNSPIRYMAWHPHTSKLAVVTGDDNVRIYSSDSQIAPILKCTFQRGVSVVAWRPYSASEIAVGCEIGIILWTVDPNSIFTKPSSNNTTVLKRSGHSPIASLTWSPDGELLVSASAADCSILVWGKSTEEPCALRRVAGGAATHVLYAPDGMRLFSSTTGIIFRVWETEMWQAERWSIRGTRVQVACWSPCSKILLFATEDETSVYALKFADASLFRADSEAPAVASAVIDLAMVELEDGDVAGGRILDMKWSPHGHHLAVTFKESRYIAIFNTNIQNILHITAYCFLSGTGIEVPSCIAFQQNFEEGALLTVGWSSGRVQHFPIIYSVPGHQSSSSF